MATYAVTNFSFEGKPGGLSYLDSDPIEAAGLSQMARDLFAGMEADRSRRSAIYWEWREHLISSVTLDQGAWLLLGVDPARPDSPAHWSVEVRERRHFQIRNLLDCAIADGVLKPVGKYVEGITRRFRLVEIAKAARAGEFATDTAQEIKVIMAASLRRKNATPSHYETEAIRTRLDVHRKFVASLGDLPKPIPPKTSKSPRRKEKGPPVNVSLKKLRSTAYDAAFRRYCETDFPAIDVVQLKPSILSQDRSDLNIKLKKGRPPGVARKSVNT